MKIVAISDIHGYEPELPPGDVLIIAGDLLTRGKMTELVQFNAWLGRIAQNYSNIIVIPGNHDWICESDTALARQILSNATMLVDEALVIDGIKFYGSPVTPQFYNWAFMKERDELKSHWANIPSDVDILITHGPPYSVLDSTARGDQAGCEALLDRITEIQPQHHIFGHIHEGGGKTTDIGRTKCHNVAYLDERYQPKNKAKEIKI